MQTQGSDAADLRSRVKSKDFSRLADPSVAGLRPFSAELNFTRSRHVMHIQVTLYGYTKLHAIHTENHFEGTVVQPELLLSGKSFLSCLASGPPFYLFIFETLVQNPGAV